MAKDDSTERRKVAGTQTLSRGLSLLECVAEGVTDVKGLSARLGTPRSTVNRMLNNLVADGYLYHIPYQGYLLGPKLIGLGAKAREQRPLVAVARRHLEALAAEVRDTVHFGIREGDYILYLEKIPGSRGLEMRSRVGSRMPLASTGLGKSLMTGLPEAEWPGYYEFAVAFAAGSADRPPMRPFPALQADLLEARARGWTSDMEENELGIRCVGAPVFDVSGAVVAAISVASAVTFMPEERMAELGPAIRAAAGKISQDFGWNGEAE